MSVVRVSWNAPTTTGGTAVTGYVVQRRVGSGTWGTLTTTAATARSYDDTTIVTSTQYGYRVAAVNAVGTGAYSAEAVTTPVTTGTVLFDAAVATKGLTAYPTSVNPQDVTIVDDPILGSARKVMRFAVHESDNTLTGNPRAQLESPKIFNEGDDIYIGYCQLFPTAWPSALPPSPAGGANFMTMAEVYGPPFSGSSPVKINMRANTPALGFQRNNTYGFDIPWEDGPILKNTWYDWVIHEKLSQDPTVGFVEIYRNLGQGWVAMPLFGQTRLYMKTLDSSNNGGANYHKIACYYASNMGVGDPMVLYHGHHKIATTFDLAAPQSYSTTAAPPTGTSSLAIYAGGPTIVSAAAQSVATTSFTVPAGSVLVANVMYNGTAAATSYTCGVTDNAGLTWTAIRQIDNVNNSGGKGGIYTAWSRVANATTMTVTGTATTVGTTNAAPRTILDVEVLTGAATTGNPIGAVASAHDTSGPFSLAVTSTAGGSMVLGAVCDWNAGGTPTPAAGVTLEATSATPNITGSVLYRPAQQTVGSSQTIASTGPSSTDQNIVVYEVLPGAVVTGAPSVPTTLGSSFTATTATITWQPPLSAGSGITGYRVSRDGTDSTGAGAYSTIVAADVRTFTMGLLNTGTAYQLSVAATSASGDGPAARVTVTPQASGLPAAAVNDTFDTVYGSAWSTNSAGASIVNGRARLANNTGFEFIGTGQTYTILGSYVLARLWPPAATGATSDSHVSMVINSPTAGVGLNITMQAVGQTISFSSQGDGTSTYYDPNSVTLPYSATAHAYWAIVDGSVAGQFGIASPDTTKVYFLTSPDKVTWTSRYAPPRPSWLTSTQNQQWQFGTHRDAGTADYAEVDDAHGLAVTSTSVQTTGDLVARTAWGAYAANNNITTFQSLQSTVAAPLRIAQFFYSWASGWPQSLSDQIAAMDTTNRKILMICWEAHGINLADIISGAKDSYIQAFIAGAATYPGTVILRLFHEANGDWYDWAPGSNHGFATSAAQFRAAWQKIVTVARAVPNSSRVKFMYCPNAGDANAAGYSMLNNTDATKNLYPGNTYVDFIGDDGYDFSDTQATSFQAVHQNAYNTLTAQHPTAPYIIGETGTHNQTGSAAWYTAAYTCQAFPRMVSVCWFSEGVWTITTDTNALAVHKAQLPRAIPYVP